jgi:hypothetical protein
LGDFPIFPNFWVFGPLWKQCFFIKS